MNSNNEFQHADSEQRDYQQAISTQSHQSLQSLHQSAPSPNNPTRVGWPSPSRQLAGLYTEGRVNYPREDSRERVGAGAGGESSFNSHPTQSPYHIHGHGHGYSSSSSSSSSSNPSSSFHSLSHLSSNHGHYSAPSPRTYPPFSATTPRTQPSTSFYRERSATSNHSIPPPHSSSSNPTASSSHHRSYSTPNQNTSDDHLWSSSISNQTQAGLPVPATTSSSSSGTSAPQPEIQSQDPPPENELAASPSNSTTTTTVKSKKRNARDQEPEEADAAGHGNGKGKKAKRKRATMACTRCRGQKLRCDGVHPCGRCKSLNKQDMCIYESPAQEKQTQAAVPGSDPNSASSNKRSTPKATSSATAIATVPASTAAPTSSAYAAYSPAPTPLPVDRRSSLVASSPRDDRGIWNPLSSNPPVPSNYSPLPSTFADPVAPQANNTNANHSTPLQLQPPPQYIQEMNSRMARIESMLEAFITSSNDRTISASHRNDSNQLNPITTSGTLSNRSSKQLNGKLPSSNHFNNQGPESSASSSSARPGSRASIPGTFLPPFSEVVFNPKVFENREVTRSNTPEDEEPPTGGEGGNSSTISVNGKDSQEHRQTQRQKEKEKEKESFSFNEDASKSRVESDRKNREGGKANGGKNGNGNDYEVRFKEAGKYDGDDSSRRADTVKASKNVVSVLGLEGAESAKDPIGHGVVTEERAQQLVDLFVEKCLPFLPILDVASTSALKVSSLQHSGPFLITAILAIASRYRPDPTNPTSTTASAPPSAPSSPRSQNRLPGQLSASGSLSIEHAALVLLAETHLGQTLSRKRHCLGDVQAALFLAAFGLRPGGKGCDSWIVTGLASRLAKRLSIGTTVCGQVDSGLSSSPAMRRTWLMLCAFDCFPSLGFGRPISPREDLDACAKTISEIQDSREFRSSLTEEGGSHGSLDSPSARARLSHHADAFVCAQVELALLSRKLLDWVSQATERQVRAGELTSPTFHSNSQQEGIPGMDYDASWISPETIWTQWRNLAKELDSWERTYDSLLSKVNHIQKIGASLYHSHVRLCLASFALQLSAVVNEELRRARREARIERGEEHHEIEEDVSFREDDEFQTAYRKSGKNAALEMVRIHLFLLESDQDQAEDSRSLEIPSIPFSPSPLAFTPDYLLVALAQSAIAYDRLSNTPSQNDATAIHVSKLKAQKFISKQDFQQENLSPILLLKSAEKVLAYLNSPRTGISLFLRKKIKDALLAHVEQSEDVGSTIENLDTSRLTSSERDNRTGQSNDISNENHQTTIGDAPSNHDDHQSHHHHHHQQQQQQWNGGGSLTDSLNSSEVSIRAAAAAAHVHNAALSQLNQDGSGSSLEGWDLEIPNSNGWNEAVNWEKDIVTMLFGGPGSGQENFGIV